MPKGFRFRANEHIRRASEFERAFAQGRTVPAGPLVVRVLRNGMDVYRLGMVVGRKHGNAVRRNRLRRLIREGFRLTMPDWPDSGGGRGLDLVVGVSSGADPDLAAVRRALTQAVTRGARDPASSK